MRQVRQDNPRWQWARFGGPLGERARKLVTERGGVTGRGEHAWPPPWTASGSEVPVGAGADQGDLPRTDPPAGPGDSFASATPTLELVQRLPVGLDSSLHLGEGRSHCVIVLLRERCGQVPPEPVEMLADDPADLLVA